MLVDLRVKNFVLIEELEINFGPGLNVLTGETGAGKSIIIGALDMLLGSRASTDVIRRGKEMAYIEAAYQPQELAKINDLLQESGIEPDPEIVLLSREIKRSGRNKSRINGQLATLNMIRQVSRYLVDIHGQHEHQLLLNSSEHLQLVDDYVGQPVEELKKQVAKKYKKIQEIDDRLAELQVDEGEKARELDMLNFQIKEISEANLKNGELPELKNEYQKLSNMEDIFSITGRVAGTLRGEDYNQEGLLDRLGELMKEMGDIKEFDPELEEYHQRIEDAFYQLQELNFDLQKYHQNLEYNEERLAEIEERLDLIQTLQKKYGDSIAKILEYKEQMVEKREQLQGRDELIAELKNKKEVLNKEYYQKAQKLSQLRKEKARQLEKQIKNEFSDLALENTVLKVSFVEKEPGETGIDRVEFLISTNPGEELKPLTQVASGGELSRIMLALKTIIADIDQVDTLIFDEVDSGVGGKTAQKMAEKMARLAKKRQILCITHLPQIASMSDIHFYIDKKTEQKKTFTVIQKLDREQKKNELARMLGGVKTTKTTMQHAEEMLQMAEEQK
ncbi:MAG: DNA repair protein RecN [Bacillota bacterium]